MKKSGKPTNTPKPSYISTGFTLASGSAIRKRILEAAGLEFATTQVAIDEESVINHHKQQPPPQIAQEVALQKAIEASKYPQKYPLVVAADQLVEFDGKYPPKPTTIDEAKTLLQGFRGKLVRLHCGAVAMEANKMLWQSATVFEVRFRNFSTKELEHYIIDGKDEIIGIATAIRLEGKGIKLIDKMKGDFFSGLGFPLMEFLKFLRVKDAS